MTDDLFIIIGLFNVLMYSYILTRNKHLTVILTVLTILALTIGLFFEAMYLTDYRIYKRYMTLLFLLGYIKLGTVREFRVVWWEFLLIAFYVIRVFVDLLRPDFELRGMFGGIGDGMFITVSYFFFKKDFLKYPNDAVIVLKIVLFSGICIASLGILEYITAWDLFETESSRFIIEYHQRSNSVFSSPEVFGITCIMCIYVSIFLSFKEAIRKATFYTVSLICLIGLFTCLYRGIWLAFIIGGIVLYLCVMLQSKQKIKIVILGTSLIIIIGFAVTVGITSLENNSFFKQRIMNKKNIESRITIYQVLFHGISERFLSGWGTATVSEHIKSLGLDKRIGSQKIATVGAHNGILAVLFENGIFLLAIYIFWYFSFLLQYRSHDILAYSTSSAAIITFLVANISLHILPGFILPSFIMVILMANNMALYEQMPDVGETFTFGVKRRSESDLV